MPWFFSDRFSVTGSAALLVYVTSFCTSPLAGYGHFTAAKAEPDENNVLRTAAATSSRPVPAANGLYCVVVLVELTSASFNCRPVQSGCSCASRAAAPATCGV